MTDDTSEPFFTRRMAMAGAAFAAVPFIGDASSSLQRISVPHVSLPPPSGSLRARAERKGLLVGTTFDVEQFGDAAYIAAIRRDCNILVPGNGFNWTRIQPRPGMPLDFSEVTPVYRLAQQIHASMRMHALVYDLTTPRWVKDLVPTLSREATEKLLTDYIQAVLAVWGDKVVHVEVVNEPAYDLSGRYRPFAFSDKLGMDYIDIAFHAAHAAAPNAMLFTNGAALEHHERIFDIFRDGMLNLLEGMVKRGVPIHAVGLEAHLMTDRAYRSQDVDVFLRRITDLGLKFMITEFDVNDRGIAGDVAARDAGVAALAKDFLDIAFSFPQCLGIVTWNGADNYSWLRKLTKEGDGPIDRQRADRQPLRPTPLDDTMHRKPLWSAIAAAIDGAPERATTA
ncbi:endo-1,4-beta-xylanase [Novosphingobium sp. B-7]|uniref:endo-1,4-beta-xylanase n=1 Tax=Novosphingobium sp. B-7 TaxID=1298855 RepID=UPI0003B5A792|nr:endo-1,4-beta-xylanase [Novosphingobium sp. B-7]